MNVHLIYRNNCNSSEVIKVIEDEDKAERYLNKKNGSTEFTEDANGNKQYNEFYEWDKFEVE